MNSPNTSSDQRRGRHVSAKAMLIAAAIVLALLLAAYAWGRLEASSRHQQQTSALQARLDENQRALAQATNRNHLLRARTQLYRAAADLDQRNFGNANDRLRAASAALGEVAADAGDPAAGDIAKLRSAVGATDINVAINLEAQRERILGFARQLDALSGETN
ncbi:MAG TPA: hypothetical protein VEY92_12480 [Pseudoxanthomonas sp.]|nr:hypothetical protein [Pseudoxanthomonas sp.]